MSESKKIVLDRSPSLAQLADIFRQKYRFSAEIVERDLEFFGEPWAAEFEALLSTLFPSVDAMTAAVKGYASFALNSMRLQSAFVKERVYKKTTHEQASVEVYFNESYMMQEYLPGLLLSHFLWPHHFRQLQFFESAFIQSMKASTVKSFAEVGVGTGIYSSQLLRRLQDVSGIGYDISPWSKKFAEAHMKAFGNANRYTIELRNVLADPIPPKSDWLVCVEVLEHLDDPVVFLRALREMMAPGARAFITAAVNAAHADHVYLYRSADDVAEQLIEADFAIEQIFVGKAYKPAARGEPVPEAAAFIVI